MNVMSSVVEPMNTSPDENWGELGGGGLHQRDAEMTTDGRERTASEMTGSLRERGCGKTSLL